MVTRANRFFWVQLSAVVMIVTLSGGPLRGQIAGNGSIQGTVSDPAGAVVPGAIVSGTNVGTKVTVNVVTTSAGLFVLSPLQPGEYSVSVSATGFSTLVQEHVRVDGMSVVSLNPVLRIGTSQQEVTVTAAPPQLDTATGTLGLTIEKESYSALPIAMTSGPRSPDSLILLLPGVAGGAGGGVGSFPALSINGGEAFSKVMYVDGISLTTSRLQGDNRDLNLQLSIEAVDQFHVETNGSPAMYEGQGAENFVLKSGTNQFHGGAYEAFRNTVLDARGFFAAVKPIEKQNEFGANGGGPFVKNRLFFYGVFDGYRIRQGYNPAFFSIPTALERSGNFTELPVTIFDPATTVCTSSGVCTRHPFAGNVIPSSRISPISQFLQSALPATTFSGVQNNWLGSQANGTDQNTVSTKVDAVLSSKNHLSALMAWGGAIPIGVPGGAQLPLPYTSSRNVSYYTNLGQLQDTHVFTSNLLNVFSAGFNRFYPPTLDSTKDGQWPTKAGITGLPPGLASDAFPGTSFSGPNAPTVWHNTSATTSYIQVANSFVYSDSLQWVHGKHSLNFGAEVHFWQDNINNPLTGSVLSGGPGGTIVGGGFNFSNLETAGFSAAGGIQATTGNAYASYLLGLVDNTGLTQNAAGTTGGRYRQYATFVQDDFRVSSRLTLNLGLRWEIPVPYREVANRLSFLNPTLPNPAVNGFPGALQFAGNGNDSCICKTPFQTHYSNFGPRVGFAYALGDKTALRGSFNIIYINAGALGGTGVTQSTGILGWLANPTFSSLDGGISPAFNWNNGFPSYAHPPFLNPTLNTGFNTTTPSGGSITLADPWLGGKAPYTENWHFTVQRQLTGSTVVTAAYSGSSGHFLPTGIGRGIYSNQIDPKYMALGTLLRATATPANIAAANAIVPGVQLPYSNFQGTIGQMLLPFPQYSGISDIYQEIGNSTYHSLQMSAQRRFSHGFSFTVAYTYSKELDDAGSNLGTGAGNGRTAYNNALEKSVGTLSVPNQLVMSYVYQLPFGKGHILNSGNPVLRQVISDWQFSGIHSYISGTPFGVIGATCNVPYAGGCYANYASGYSGSPVINGGYGNGGANLIGSNTTSFININAFANPAAYTFGSTPRTLSYGLRNNPTLNEDLDLNRTFKISERKTFQFRLDAFNAPNRVRFGSIGTSIASASFGKIGSQSNSARIMQIEGRFSF